MHKEVNWLAIDYEEERKFKIAMAYRLSHESAEIVQKLRAEKGRSVVYAK